MRIEVVADVKTTLGESPVWSVAEQRLYWVDSLGRRIFRCTADGREVRAWDLPANIGSLGLRAAGGAVLAMRTGFHLIDFASGELAFIANPEADLPHNTLNDGKVDRCGRFFVGSMDITEAEPSGSLYRLDADLSLHRIAEGLIVANGPCWSPDDRLFYFGDSGTRTIWVADYDTASGAISDRRSFAVAEGAAGSVDGATVDSDGFLWSARVYAGRLVRHAPDGSVDRVIAMPVRDVTSVMFGGPDLDILFVTSMASTLAPGLARDRPQRGAVFAVHGLGVRGLPEPLFAG